MTVCVRTDPGTLARTYPTLLAPHRTTFSRDQILEQDGRQNRVAHVY